MYGNCVGMLTLDALPHHARCNIAHLWVAGVPVNDEVVVGRVGEHARRVGQDGAFACGGKVLPHAPPEDLLHTHVTM